MDRNEAYKKFVVESSVGKMTPSEEGKAEDFVKAMKKKKEEFKQRYGDRWKEVMYATANKMAQESVESLSEEEAPELEGHTRVSKEEYDRHANAEYKGKQHYHPWLVQVSRVTKGGKIIHYFVKHDVKESLDLDKMESILESEQLDELEFNTLAKYKSAAQQQAKEIEAAHGVDHSNGRIPQTADIEAAKAKMDPETRARYERLQLGINRAYDKLVPKNRKVAPKPSTPAFGGEHGRGYGEAEARYMGDSVELSFKEFVKHLSENDDYRGEHTAPGPDSGDPMHDVTRSVYPKDFHSSNGFRYYSDLGNSYDRDSHNVVTGAKDQPEKKVWIHRAVPKSVHAEAMKTDTPLKHMIKKGDWVTTSKEYAKEHGEGALGGDYKIASMRVPAKHLYTNGDSIHEWGYHPDDEKSEDKK